MPILEDKRLILTKDAVAKYCRKGTTFIQEQIDCGELDVCHFIGNNQCLISRGAVDRWIERAEERARNGRTE